MTNFVGCHVASKLKDKEATQPPRSCLCERTADAQWPVADRPRRKGHGWSQIVTCTCYLQDAGAEKPAGKFEFYAITANIPC